MLISAIVAAGLALGLCPDPAAHEGPRDCPWAAVARQAQAAARAGRPVAKTFLKALPSLWSQIEHDAALAPLHAAWGQSVNVDENAHAEVIDHALLAALAARLGVPGSGELVHAGLQHTYGYLFSTLWTPYGYKRSRWVDGELERGLALPAGVLGPTPHAGSLYDNVTCLLARIAFSTSERRGLDAACSASAAPEITRYAVPPHVRLEETSAGISLRSEWIPLGATKRFLFVYSVVIGKNAPRLLTSFPVDTGFVDALRDPKTLGDKQPISVRYNAFVPGLSTAKHALTGQRRLVAVP